MAIKQTVSEMQTAGKVIGSAMLVCQQVKDTHDMEVTMLEARQVMRKDCQLSYVKAKKLAAGTNT